MNTPAPTSPPRVAVVAGGSGSIGRAVCDRLAAGGMSVLVPYAGSPVPSFRSCAEGWTAKAGCKARPGRLSLVRATTWLDTRNPARA
jgi:NAD(P)-dependent dehydrogenase (short-subunit alcohol dehydrogenase family)